MSREEVNHRYYQKHREEILEKKKLKDLTKLGTTDFSQHEQEDLEKERSAVESEFRKLGLLKFRKLLHAQTKEEITRYQKE